MSKAKYRLEKILECIEDIDFILKEKGAITQEEYEVKKKEFLK